MTDQTVLGYDAVTKGAIRSKNLFEALTAAEIKERMERLRPASQRLWGKMNPAQTLAHCSIAMLMAMGNENPPQLLIGRIFGPLAKKSLIIKGNPMRRNAQSDKKLVVSDDRDLAAEKRRLCELIERFAAGGSAACVTHSHMFFGPLTPVEWAALMYQHLDHHLRQFGA